MLHVEWVIALWLHTTSCFKKTLYDGKEAIGPIIFILKYIESKQKPYLLEEVIFVILLGSQNTPPGSSPKTVTSPCLAVAATAPLASSFALESVSEISEEHRNLASEWMHEVRMIMVVLLHSEFIFRCPRGSFNNHVDKILPVFYPLPPSRGQTWTFH